MASILKQLDDADLDAVRHMIRRDAQTDEAIAEFVDGKLPRGKKMPAGKSARAMAIARYRESKDYRDWLRRWQDRNSELQKDLALQRERFQTISNLVQTDDGDGFEPLSRSIQARLLTLAAEAKDDDLINAAAGRGWVKNLLRLVQQEQLLQMRKEQEHKAKEAMKLVDDKKLTREEQKARMKEIFGLS